MPESNIFFIADCHFGDEMIARYESRPYIPAGEIVERFNQVVSPDDKTYFLGDIASSDFVATGRLKETIAQMNGYKVLVLGNHDREISVSPSFWMDIGFDEISTNPVLVDNFFLASHEPLYVTANMPYVNVFGHVHGNPNYKTYSAGGACVCVERHEYAPVSLSKIKSEIAYERDFLICPIKHAELTDGDDD